MAKVLEVKRTKHKKYESSWCKRGRKGPVNSVGGVKEMASFLPVVSGDKFTLLYIIIYLKRNAVKAFLSYNLEKREIKLTFVVVYKGLFSFGSSGVRNAQPCLLKDEREKR